MLTFYMPGNIVTKDLVRSYKDPYFLACFTILLLHIMRSCMGNADG